MSGHEALYYRKLDDKRVKCALCPHGCMISPGKSGICLARENHDGMLVSANYAEATSVAMDPIEKKPLYHFHPDCDILSIGSWGCNFKCSFCQNWSISQQRRDSEIVSPPVAVDVAKQRQSSGIAYTYNEPLISFEYVLETSKLAREAGLMNVLVTNGFINPEPLGELLPLIDAMNIDIKCIRNDFYHELCHGELGPVLETAKTARDRCHVEITNLIIPGRNDSEEDLRGLASWIVTELGSDTPVHLSAYSPRHRLQERPTTPEILKMAYGIFAEALHYVYLGNLRSSVGADTVCSNCGEVLIERSGYSTRMVGLSGTKCSSCGNENNIIR